MTGRSVDRVLGRAFLGDSLATIVSAFGGGTGVTTYAENIGVMAATRVYSTLLFVVAAVVSILLGFSPKFGALIRSIPDPVIGGLSIILFGLIAAMAGRIWVENKVDFSKPRNLITPATRSTAKSGRSVSLISIQRPISSRFAQPSTSVKVGMRVTAKCAWESDRGIEAADLSESEIGREAVAICRAVERAVVKHDGLALRR
jgi:Permease family